jgi:hypothetical protein
LLSLVLAPPPPPQLTYIGLMSTVLSSLYVLSSLCVAGGGFASIS